MPAPDPMPDPAPEPAPDPALETEFDALMNRAGLRIPHESRVVLLQAFAQLRGQLALLRGSRTAAAEPSNVFRLAPLEVQR